MTDARVLLERDDATGIARITLNNPERRNCYDPPMREQLGAYLDELADGRRASRSCCCAARAASSRTGADMGNAYTWYEANGATRERRRPAAAARASAGGSSVDRKTFELLPRAHRLPEGDRRRGARLRARRRASSSR